MRRHDGSLKLHLQGHRDVVGIDYATLQANGLGLKAYLLTLLPSLLLCPI